jgi:hypothetical protein
MDTIQKSIANNQFMMNITNGEKYIAIVKKIRVKSCMLEFI